MFSCVCFSPLTSVIWLKDLDFQIYPTHPKLARPQGVKQGAVSQGRHLLAGRTLCMPASSPRLGYMRLIHQFFAHRIRHDPQEEDILKPGKCWREPGLWAVFFFSFVLLRGQGLQIKGKGLILFYQNLCIPWVLVMQKHALMCAHMQKCNSS